eukprot:500192_1
MGPIGAINNSPPIIQYIYIHIHIHIYLMMHQKEPLFDGKLNCNECVLSSLYILVFSMSYNMQQQIENNKIELTEIKTTETALINYNVETNLISKSDNYTLKDKNNNSQNSDT